MNTIVSNICFSIALAFVLYAGAATFPAASAQAADIEVKIDSFAFAPQRVVVKAGTTVTWINDDDIPHTVASSTKVFKSSALDNKDKYSFTFTTPGTYEYFCSLHPHMTGSIVVVARTASRSEQ
jgi:plastocyanin